MSCRSGCRTKDCGSYAACCRNSGMRVAYADSANGQDYTKQKHWDKELQRYRDVRAQGIEPLGTTHAELDRSERLADMVSRASVETVDA